MLCYATCLGLCSCTCRLLPSIVYRRARLRLHHQSNPTEDRTETHNGRGRTVWGIKSLLCRSLESRACPEPEPRCSCLSLLSIDPKKESGSKNPGKPSSFALLGNLIWVYTPITRSLSQPNRERGGVRIFSLSPTLGLSLRLRLIPPFALALAGGLDRACSPQVTHDNACMHMLATQKADTEVGSKTQDTHQSNCCSLLSRPLSGFSLDSATFLLNRIPARSNWPGSTRIAHNRNPSHPPRLTQALRVIGIHIECIQCMHPVTAPHPFSLFSAPIDPATHTIFLYLTSHPVTRRAFLLSLSPRSSAHHLRCVCSSGTPENGNSLLSSHIAHRIPTFLLRPPTLTAEHTSLPSLPTSTTNKSPSSNYLVGRTVGMNHLTSRGSAQATRAETDNH